jgi:hypothetical protein
MTSLLAIALLFATATPAPGDWKEIKKTDDGIFVFKREVPGSPVLAFKGEGYVDAPLSKVATIIFDTSRAKEWIADLEESKIVRWTGDEEFLEYDHMGTPFILKDRDFVSTVKIEESAEEQQIRFHYANAVDPAVPETSCVRGDLMDTTYVLTSAGPGRTHVIANIHIDPKGWIPKFVANWATADWPVETFRGLRKQAAKTDVTVDSRFVLPVTASGPDSGSAK